MLLPFIILYEQNLASLRTNLDEATFEAAFTMGQAMTLDEAIVNARQPPAGI